MWHAVIIGAGIGGLLLQTLHVLLCGFSFSLVLSEFEYRK